MVILIVLVFLIVMIVFSFSYRSKIKNHSTNALQQSGMQPTKCVDGFLALDDNQKYWQAISPRSDNGVYSYYDVTGCELIENGKAISGGIGRAVVGGAIAGGVGAIVGASTASAKERINEMKMKITLNNVNNPTVYINLLPLGPVMKTHPGYKKAFDAAHEIQSIFTIIIENNLKQQNLQTQVYAQQIQAQQAQPQPLQGQNPQQYIPVEGQTQQTGTVYPPQ